VAEQLVTLAQQVAVVCAQPLIVQRPVDDHQQLLDLERLLQVVECAQLHGFDRAVDRTVRRHHHDLRTFARGRRGHELPDELESGHLRHHVVGDEHVEGAPTQQALGLARAARCHHLVPLFAQRGGQQIAKFGFVFDDQNGASSVGHGPIGVGVSVPWPLPAPPRAVPPRPSTMFLVIVHRGRSRALGRSG
jgi:hypothetical protein